MSSFAYDRLPTGPGSNGQSWRNDRRRKLLFVSGTLVTLIFLWIASKVFAPKPPYSFQRDYQDLGPPPLTDSSSPAPDPKKTAVVSTLYTDSFVWGAAVLGYSVRQQNVTSRLLLPYLEDRISEEALCIAKTVGWEPVAVPSIPPPHNGKGIHHRFSDQYTKLNIWSLDTSHGIEKAVYLDSDILVRRNFNELFNLPFNFAAVPDVYTDERRGFTVNFNAGMLAFRPSTALLNHFKEVMEGANYPLEQAEQSFLNLFFAANALRLPYAYNANLATKVASRSMWEAMKDEMRIVHYTMVKPFVKEQSKNAEIPTESTLRDIIRDAALRGNGFYHEEVGWWREVYDEMMGDFRKEIDECHKLRK